MINKRTKVLFLPAWYPSSSNRVLGIFVKQHALALNDSVTLAVFHVCPDQGGRKRPRFEKAVEDDLIVYRNHFYQFKFKLLRPLNWLTYFYSLILGYFRVVRDFGHPDINHVHVLTRVGVVALIANFIFKTPYCISEHWSRYLPARNSYHGILRKALTSFIVKRSRGISTVSQSLKNAMQSHFIDHPNFMIIPNTVNFNLFHGRANEISGKEFQFLHVSGLTDSTKNVSGIIKAFYILKNEGTCVNLNLVGNCTHQQDLKDLVRDLYLEDSIRFLGELHGTELVAAYQEANAFVLFSFFENQPCVLLEAFSVGIPVVATNVGGIAEIVNKENGLLTPPGDYKRLAERMKDLIRDKERFDPTVIRAQAELHFGYPAVRDRFVKFYSKSLKGSY
ncbi:glycosyltransferase [Desertivirga arenae]|uniref:glycosyltransferase n=1 Tax=Desertivirga arenae TaxID=2810309 RepID=UPI001A97AC14|nr:glycosyltransferase [Pedobacter sp. SYSU D00823]